MSTQADHRLIVVALLGTLYGCGAPDCPSYLKDQGEDCIAPSKPDSGSETADRESSQTMAVDAGTTRSTVSDNGGRASTNSAAGGGSAGAGGDTAMEHGGAPDAGTGGNHDAGVPRDSAAGAGGASMTNQAGSKAPGIVCGNGVREGGELCEGADCPTKCDAPASDCLPLVLHGAAKTCDAQCVPEEIKVCTSGDKCCPMGCNYGNDHDCSQSCGDGVVSGMEKCEPGSTDHPCPNASDCDDGNVCTEDRVTGAECSAECTHTTVMRAAVSCDDGDPCTDDTMVESAAECSFVCMHTAPRRRTGSCADSDPCTDDTPVPSATSCTYECPHTARNPEPADCADSDPCTDDTPVMSATRCVYECPHKRQQPAAISCDDGDQCTADTQVQSKTRCAYECEHKTSSSGKTGTSESSCNNRDDDCDGKIDEGALNECNGCGMVHYDPQAVPPGKPCAYYWTNDNSGDCSTTGVGKCVGTDTVICDAPKPACAP